VWVTHVHQERKGGGGGEGSVSSDGVSEQRGLGAVGPDIGDACVGE